MEHPEAISPEKREILCRVLDTKYKKCIRNTSISSIPQMQERCGGFYADLVDFCSDEFKVRANGSCRAHLPKQGSSASGCWARRSLLKPSSGHRGRGRGRARSGAWLGWYTLS
jgi:hypothetical protein